VDLERVERPPDVLGGGDLDHADEPSLGIDVDREVLAERIEKIAKEFAAAQPPTEVPVTDTVPSVTTTFVQPCEFSDVCASATGLPRTSGSGTLPVDTWSVTVEPTTTVV